MPDLYTKGNWLTQNTFKYMEHKKCTIIYIYIYIYIDIYIYIEGWIPAHISRINMAQLRSGVDPSYLK